MYQNILGSKWENLSAELAVDLKKKGESMTADRLNDWYKVKAFQFRSINSIESMQLEQAGSKEFVDEFRKTLDSFYFSAPDAASFKKVAPAWQGLLFGLIAAIAGFIILKPFTLTVITIILSAACFFAVTIIFNNFFRKRVADDNQTAKNEHYVRQFEGYLNTLLAVCEKNGVK